MSRNIRYWGGIDPGSRGGICVIDTKRDVVRVVPMPTIKITLTRKRRMGGFCERHEISVAGLRRILEPLAYDPRQIHFSVEQVWAWPKMGVSGACEVGYAFGTVVGVLAGLCIPFSRYRPTEWKPAMLAGNKSDKSVAVARALELRPELTPKIIWYRESQGEVLQVQHDGMAEAYLIAEYGRQRLTTIDDDPLTSGKAIDLSIF